MTALAIEIDSPASSTMAPRETPFSAFLRLQERLEDLRAELGWYFITFPVVGSIMAYHLK